MYIQMYIFHMEKKLEELKRLWEIKNRYNLSDKALEKELGADRMTIWRWRNQKIKPSPLAMGRISEFLKKHKKP